MLLLFPSQASPPVFLHGVAAFGMPGLTHVPESDERQASVMLFYIPIGRPSLPAYDLTYVILRDLEL